jgi:hypothetical protein
MMGVVVRGALGGDCVQVGSYEIIKGIDYLQTEDGVPPSSPFLYYFDAMVQLDGEMASGMTIETLTSSFEMSVLGTTWEAGVDFPSATALENAVPELSVVTIESVGGTLGDRVQSVPVGAAVYPERPYLLGCGYSDLQNANPLLPITIRWSEPDENTTGISIGIYSEFVTGDVFCAELGPEARMFTIPAGVLIDNAPHELIVEFSNTTQLTGDDCPGFGVGAEGVSIYSSGVSVLFTASLFNSGGCDPDLNCDGEADFFDVSVLLQTGLDYNGDTVFDFFDISAFLQDLSAGCP